MLRVCVAVYVTQSTWSVVVDAIFVYFCSWEAEKRYIVRQYTDWVAETLAAIVYKLFIGIISEIHNAQRGSVIPHTHTHHTFEKSQLIHDLIIVDEYVWKRNIIINLLVCEHTYRVMAMMRWCLYTISISCSQKYGCKFWKQWLWQVIIVYNEWTEWILTAVWREWTSNGRGEANNYRVWTGNSFRSFGRDYRYWPASIFDRPSRQRLQNALRFVRWCGSCGVFFP